MGKEKADDFPDWIDKEYSREEGESLEDFLENALNDKKGKGNWKKGVDSDYSKYKKNYHRRGKKDREGGKKIIIFKKDQTNEKEEERETSRSTTK